MNLLQQELEEYRRTPDGRVIQGCSHTSRILSHKYRNKTIMYDAKLGLAVERLPPNTTMSSLWRIS